MKDLSLGNLIPVFEEIFGRGLVWILVAAAVVVTLAYLYVLIRATPSVGKSSCWRSCPCPWALSRPCGFKG